MGGSCRRLAGGLGPLLRPGRRGRLRRISFGFLFHGGLLYRRRQPVMRPDSGPVLKIHITRLFRPVHGGRLDVLHAPFGKKFPEVAFRRIFLRGSEEFAQRSQFKGLDPFRENKAVHVMVLEESQKILGFIAAARNVDIVEHPVFLFEGEGNGFLVQGIEHQAHQVHGLFHRFDDHGMIEPVKGHQLNGLRDQTEERGADFLAGQDIHRGLAAQLFLAYHFFAYHFLAGRFHTITPSLSSALPAST